MDLLHRFSIRARLTLIFVVAIAAILSFTGLALVHLVRNSLATDASNQIQSEMLRTQERFVMATSAQHYKVVLPMHGNVVIQVTNIAGTQIWAASAAIASAPILAHETFDADTSNKLGVKYMHSPAALTTLSEISSGQVGTIFTKRGSGLIFGFVYGQGITHSVNVLDGQPGRLVPAAAVDDRGPDLDRDGTGARAGRVDSTACRHDRRHRPLPARHAHGRQRRDRAHGAHGERHAGTSGGVVAVRAGVRLECQPRTPKSA